MKNMFKLKKINKLMLSIMVSVVVILSFGAIVFANGNVITNKPPQLIDDNYTSVNYSINNGINSVTNDESLNNVTPNVDINSNPNVDINSNPNVDVNTNGEQASGGGLEKAEKYVSSKMFDIVSFLQVIVKPFIYIMFIVSAIMLLIGILGGSKSKFKGLLGMAFSVLAYIAITQSPQIIGYFSLWLCS